MTDQTTDAPRYSVEFPDFPASDLPALPSGFTDTSWCNDVCPSFWWPALGVAVYVDYSDLTLREFQGAEAGKRFGLFATGPDGGRATAAGDNSDLVVNSDDWADVLAVLNVRRLAVEFARQLGDDLTHNEFLEMRRLNATPEYAEGICASHNYCDANQSMLDAFAETYGHEAEISMTPEGDYADDYQTMGVAWDYARAAFLIQDAPATVQA